MNNTSSIEFSDEFIIQNGNNANNDFIDLKECKDILKHLKITNKLNKDESINKKSKKSNSKLMNFLKTNLENKKANITFKTIKLDKKKCICLNNKLDPLLPLIYNEIIKYCNRNFKEPLYCTDTYTNEKELCVSIKNTFNLFISNIKKTNIDNNNDVFNQLISINDSVIFENKSLYKINITVLITINNISEYIDKVIYTLTLTLNIFKGLSKIEFKFVNLNATCYLNKTLIINNTNNNITKEYFKDNNNIVFENIKNNLFCYNYLDNNINNLNKYLLTLVN